VWWGGGGYGQSHSAMHTFSSFFFALLSSDRGIGNELLRVLSFLEIVRTFFFQGVDAVSVVAAAAAIEMSASLSRLAGTLIQNIGKKQRIRSSGHSLFLVSLFSTSPSLFVYNTSLLPLLFLFLIALFSFCSHESLSYGRKVIHVVS
jgi:hypothetical protein